LIVVAGVIRPEVTARLEAVLSARIGTHIRGNLVGYLARADIAANAVTSAKVANGSLRRADFARGVLAKGGGVVGLPGPQGPEGPLLGPGPVKATLDCVQRLVGVESFSFDDAAIVAVALSPS
jgi:hypothetical protein